jgi:hypothetical protein
MKRVIPAAVILIAMVAIYTLGGLAAIDTVRGRSTDWVWIGAAWTIMTGVTLWITSRELK